MITHSPTARSLFRRSRIRLALWYSLVMSSILGLSSFTVYRSITQANWDALEREVESIGGTLHDSLEPLLPSSGTPTPILKQILPELCLANQVCDNRPTLIERHTTGISDRSTYYVRLLDHHGKLIAFSPNQPLPIPQSINLDTWQTFRAPDGVRYHQFTTLLHHAESHSDHPDTFHQSSWGYLQIGRTLQSLDEENKRIQVILIIGSFVTLIIVIGSSWWLSGLAMKPIYQSYQQQQQFTANAAHELRSPLTSLLATVEATTRTAADQESTISGMLNTIERQGRRLSYLINDLLLLSSLEQSQSPKLFQKCNLNDLTRDLFEEFLELALAANVQLELNAPEQDIYISGDESKLYRLISNLIANAINYTPAGGQASITLAQQGRTAIIAVRDTGIGISADEIPHIFERFYRVNSDRSRKTGGSGLGLAIAQAITRYHQGHLTVDSTIGKGSLFTVHLPCTTSNES